MLFLQTFAVAVGKRQVVLLVGAQISSRFVRSCTHGVFVLSHCVFVSFVVAKCTFFVFLSAFLCDEKARKGMKNVSDEFEAFAK